MSDDTKIEKIKSKIQEKIDNCYKVFGDDFSHLDIKVYKICLSIIDEVEKESETMDKQAGWNEYKDIKETLESLLDKGYTKEMIQTVLEQTDIKENKYE